MRACATCFYYQGGNISGECYNRPPFMHIVSERNGNGDLTVESVAIRPSVRANDYCAFYAITAEERARLARKGMTS